MKLLDRELKVLICQNLGRTYSGTTTDPISGVDITQEYVSTIRGNQLEITPYIAEIGTLGWEVDSQITMSTMTSSSVKVIDSPTNVVWSFIQAQIASPPAPTATPIYPGAVLPPWITITLDGVTMFYGCIDTASLQRVQSESSWEINISINDWYSLASKAGIPDPQQPDNFLREMPIISNGTTRAAETNTGQSNTAGVIYAAYQNGVTGVINKVYFSANPGWFIVGDEFTCATTGSTVYTCTGLGYETVNSVTYQFALLSGWAWPNVAPPSGFWGAIIWAMGGGPITTHSFTRLSSNYIRANSWLVTANVAKSTTAAPLITIPVDTTDSLVPGDVLLLAPDTTRTSGGTFTINDIDAENKLIIVDKPIDTNLIIGDALTLDLTSLQYRVFDPFKRVIQDCVGQLCYAKPTIPSATVDFSLFEPATLPFPCLTWLGMRGNLDSIIHTVYDIQPTLTALQVKGVGASWTGNVGVAPTWEPTWVKDSATYTKYVDWTQQLPLSSPPSMLMPDSTGTLSVRVRNRPVVRRTRDSQTGPDRDSGDSYNAPLAVLAQDYVGFRRLVQSRPTGSLTYSVNTATWNGSVWSSNTHHTWTGDPIIAACPLPAATYTTGTGSAFLVLSRNLSTKVYTVTLYLSNYTGIHNTSFQLADHDSFDLVQTPFGVWLVSSTQYIKILWNPASGLDHEGYGSVVNTDITSNIAMLSTTFVQPDTNHIYCLATDSYSKDGVSVAETYMLQLGVGTTRSYRQPVLNFEKVCDGMPRVCMTVLDPTMAGRMVGLVGCRMFQISTIMSTVLEKVCCNGLTVADAVQNCCMIQNCVGVPHPSGQLSIVSRSQTKTIYTDITVGIVSRTESRISDKFYSQINVSGNDKSAVGFANGQLGGQLLELSSHPYVFTASEARAISMSLSNFFGWARGQEEHEWVWTTGGRPAWETLAPMQLITVNGGSKLWFVTKVNFSIMEPKATVTLLDSLYTINEASALVPPGYPGDPIVNKLPLPPVTP